MGEFNLAPALNLAICWKNFLNKILFDIELGNLINLNLLRIFREYTSEIFYCKDASILLKLNNSLSHHKFISYLTSLIEGDGTIIVPKTERSSKGKLNYPFVQIVFYLKNLPLALLV